MKFVSKVYTTIMYLFLYLPILILVIFSFNASKSRVTWNGFTLYWYERLFDDKEVLAALFNTLLVALVAAVLSTIIGTMASIGISSLNKKVKKIVMSFTNIPMISPEIVTGVSLMLLYVFVYSRFGFLKPGLVTLILSHITFCLPYVILSILPKLRQFDKSLYEAALDLGCTPMNAFFKITIPQIMPGILSGALMAFTLSIDDFVISYFTSGTVQTLPIIIYSMTRKIISPEINALSTLLFGIVLFLLLLVNFQQVKSSKKRRAKI